MTSQKINMPRNKNPQGAFSGHLKNVNLDIFDSTFTEFTKYQSKKTSKTLCLGKLLSHIYDTFKYKAIFAFKLEGNEIELLFHKSNTSEMRAISDNILNHGIAYKHHDSDTVRVLEIKDISAIGLKANDKGVVIYNRTFPLLTSPDSHVVIYFINCQSKATYEFEREWLNHLLICWSDSFEARLNEFKHDINRFKAEPDPELLKDAITVHPWLRCADLCEICETGLGHVEKDEDVREGLEIKIKEFGKEWHCCLDRCWPCDGGREFGEQEFGPLNWYLWRLSNGKSGVQTDNVDYREKGYEFTLKDVEAKLGYSTLRAPLNLLLDKYFLLQIHKNRRKIDTMIDNSGADNLKKNKEYFGRFMAERISDAPIRPESVESIIWTLSEYAYSVLGVDRRLHLASHLRHAARGEPSLHMMKDFYRDHFFHTIEVCQLGQLLADVRPLGAGKTQKCPSKSLMSITNSMKEWYLASLLHDIGYGVDVCDSLKDWLDFFAQDAFHSLGKRIGRVLEGDNSDGNNGINKKDEASRKDFEDFYTHAGFDKDIDKPFKDHGLMGAYHLHTLVKNIQKSNINNSIEDTESSIQAIAKHNCQRIRIDYAKEPLSALLVLCDTLQAWRRPQFDHFSQGPSWMMSAMNPAGHISNPPQTTNAKLLTNLRFDKTLIPRFSRFLVLRLIFDEAVNRDSFVFNIWLDALCNFQRVDFSKLPFDIFVQIETPTYRPPGESRKICQMDRLRDAAADTHMAYLENFLEYSKPKNNPIPEVINKEEDTFKVKIPISYYVNYDKDEIPQQELLSISLKQMDGSRKYITDSLSRFRKDLKGWKRYPEDRLMLGDYSPWHHQIW